MLIAAAVAVLVLMFVPGGQYVLIPLRYLNTLVHEAGHAIAAVLSGGGAIAISVSPDGSGLTTSMGGMPLLISPAGYIGATVVGALLLAAGRRAESARTALTILGVSLAIITLIWVRNLFGWLIGAPLAVLLLVATRSMKGEHLMFLARAVGLVQCLESIRSVRDLVLLNAEGHQHNDAAILAGYTGVPPMVWAVMWSLVSLAILFVTLRDERHPSKR